MRQIRNLIVGLLLWGALPAEAQLITPVDGNPEFESSAAGPDQAKRAPVLAAKWPFKFGKRLFGKDQPTDPFLEGAQAQQRLAERLSGRAELPAPRVPPPASDNGVVGTKAYPWPAPVGSGTHAIVPTGASSNTTWSSPPAEQEANFIAQSATVVPPSVPASGKRFSHFAASNAQNPPPAAIPTGPRPPEVNTAVAVAGAPPSSSASANVTVAAELPDTMLTNSTPEPRFSPSGSPAQETLPAPSIIAPKSRPTTLAAGPRAQLPVGQPAVPNQAAELVPPASISEAQAQPSTIESPRPPESANQFSVDKMDQDIWGPSLAQNSPQPQRPAMTRSDVLAATRGEQFVPAGGSGVSALINSGAAPTTTTNNNQAPATSKPFATGPRVALLDHPVVQTEPSPGGGNVLVHGALDEGTRVLAIVGDQSILAGDVLGHVNEMLAPIQGQASEQQIAEHREKLIQEMLPRLIERKLIFFDFIKKIPVEKIPEVEQAVFKHFNENRLPEILTKSKLHSPAELDAKLRSLGSSLASQQRMFFEQMVAQEAVQREAGGDDEVTHEQLLAYYNEHLDEYSFPAKVRWERLAIDPGRFASPEQAYNAIARLGNRVFHGASLGSVATESSHGPRAASGGQYNWTTEGSLVNKEIDRLLFMIPVGQLSKVVKGDDMFQIIRVIERMDAGAKPFTAVQSEISEAIKKQRFEQRVEAYLARLRNETYVWSSTDGDAPGLQPAQVEASQPAAFVQ